MEADDFSRQASSLEKERTQQKYDGAMSYRFILSVKAGPLVEQKGTLVFRRQIGSPVASPTPLADSIIKVRKLMSAAI